MPCHKKHKMFLSYLRFSTKEGLNSDTNIKDQDIRFDKYDKDIYRECECCYQVFDIQKAFKENAFMCNGCYKLLQNENIRKVISPKIFIYSTENQMYRICTNIDRYSAESIFHDENIKDKEGSISNETIYKFLNFKTSQDIKESPWVALHLRCPIKSLNAE